MTPCSRYSGQISYGSVGDLSVMDGSGRLFGAGSTCTVSCMW